MELKNIKKDIVNKAKNLDTMTTITPFKFLWCPHNYRLKITKKNLPILLNKEIKSGIKRITGKEPKHNKKNKIIIKNFYNLTIEINPTCIIIIYPSEKWYLLKGSMPEINTRLDNIVTKIERKCIKECKKIVKLFKIKAYFNSKVWVRNEDHVKNEDFLGKIDPDLIMHDTVFKKVYPEGIEFKSPFALKTFVNNRAIEMVAPEIAARLDKFIEVMEKNTEALHLEIYNKKLHQKVLESMDRSLIKFSSALEHLNSNILKVKYSGRRLSGLERLVIR